MADPRQGDTIYEDTGMQDYVLTPEEYATYIQFKEAQTRHAHTNVDSRALNVNQPVDFLPFGSMAQRQGPVSSRSRLSPEVPMYGRNRSYIQTQGRGQGYGQQESTSNIRGVYSKRVAHLSSYTPEYTTLNLPYDQHPVNSRHHVTEERGPHADLYRGVQWNGYNPPPAQQRTHPKQHISLGRTPDYTQPRVSNDRATAYIDDHQHSTRPPLPHRGVYSYDANRNQPYPNLPEYFNIGSPPHVDQRAALPTPQGTANQPYRSTSILQVQNDLPQGSGRDAGRNVTKELPLLSNQSTFDSRKGVNNQAKEHQRGSQRQSQHVNVHGQQPNGTPRPSNSARTQHPPEEEPTTQLHSPDPPSAGNESQGLPRSRNANRHHSKSHTAPNNQGSRLSYVLNDATCKLPLPQHLVGTIPKPLSGRRGIPARLACAREAVKFRRISTFGDISAYRYKSTAKLGLAVQDMITHFPFLTMAQNDWLATWLIHTTIANYNQSSRRRITNGNGRTHNAQGCGDDINSSQEHFRNPEDASDRGSDSEHETLLWEDFNDDRELELPLNSQDYNGPGQQEEIEDVDYGNDLRDLEQGGHLEEENIVDEESQNNEFIGEENDEVEASPLNEFPWPPAEEDYQQAEPQDSYQLAHVEYLENENLVEEHEAEDAAPDTELFDERLPEDCQDEQQSDAEEQESPAANSVLEHDGIPDKQSDREVYTDGSDTENNNRNRYDFYKQHMAIGATINPTMNTDTYMNIPHTEEGLGFQALVSPRAGDHNAVMVSRSVGKHIVNKKADNIGGSSTQNSMEILDFEAIENNKQASRNNPLFDPSPMVIIELSDSETGRPGKHGGKSTKQVHQSMVKSKWKEEYTRAKDKGKSTLSTPQQHDTRPVYDLYNTGIPNPTPDRSDFPYARFTSTESDWKRQSSTVGLKREPLRSLSQETDLYGPGKPHSTAQSATPCRNSSGMQSRSIFTPGECDSKQVFQDELNSQITNGGTTPANNLKHERPWKFTGSGQSNINGLASSESHRWNQLYRPSYDIDREASTAHRGCASSTSSLSPGFRQEMETHTFSKLDSLLQLPPIEQYSNTLPAPPPYSQTPSSSIFLGSSSTNNRGQQGHSRTSQALDVIRMLELDPIPDSIHGPLRNELLDILSSSHSCNAAAEYESHQHGLQEHTPRSGINAMEDKDQNHERNAVSEDSNATETENQSTTTEEDYSHDNLSFVSGNSYIWNPKNSESEGIEREKKRLKQKVKSSESESRVGTRVGKQKQYLLSSSSSEEQDPLAFTFTRKAIKREPVQKKDKNVDRAEPSTEPYAKTPMGFWKASRTLSEIDRWIEEHPDLYSDDTPVASKIQRLRRQRRLQRLQNRKLKKPVMPKRKAMLPGSGTGSSFQGRKATTVNQLQPEPEDESQVPDAGYHIDYDAELLKIFGNPAGTVSPSVAQNVSSGVVHTPARPSAMEANVSLRSNPRTSGKSMPAASHSSPILSLEPEKHSPSSKLSAVKLAPHHLRTTPLNTNHTSRQTQGMGQVEPRPLSLTNPINGTAKEAKTRNTPNGNGNAAAKPARELAAIEAGVQEPGREASPQSKAPSSLKKHLNDKNSQSFARFLAARNPGLAKKMVGGQGYYNYNPSRMHKIEKTPEPYRFPGYKKSGEITPS
ncbi:hypothetical protein DFH27DRAFT_605765 [Peziza echinospora]|nr:hypothetical protein DFH27DRAFT_605765 [Peziza echinospora]